MDEIALDNSDDKKELENHPLTNEEKYAKVYYWIKYFSVGKYYTKFYHEGKDAQSSVFGGLTTIISIFVLIGFALATIVTIFTGNV